MVKVKVWNWKKNGSTVLKEKIVSYKKYLDSFDYQIQVYV